jgi:hypothetical protein
VLAARRFRNASSRLTVNSRDVTAGGSEVHQSGAALPRETGFAQTFEDQ